MYYDQSGLIKVMQLVELCNLITYIYILYRLFLLSKNASRRVPNRTDNVHVWIHVGYENLDITSWKTMDIYIFMVWCVKNILAIQLKHTWGTLSVTITFLLSRKLNVYVSVGV